jgi:uncharacterized protein (DUF362 family)
MSSNKAVVVLRTAPERLQQDIGRALDHAAVAGLEPSRRTVLKINGNFNIDYPGSNTSAWFLDGLLAELRHRGFGDLACIEGDLPEFQAKDMVVDTPLGEVMQGREVPFVAFEQLERDAHELPRLLEGAQVINVPVLHSHGHAVISCATKNLFGLLPVTRRKYHGILSSKLLELYANVPCFTIVDGTVGMQGESTRRGDPVRCDLVLAGWDCLTIDVVAARVMGFPPESVPLLSEAARRALLDTSGVPVVGDFASENVPNYRFELRLGAIRRVANLIMHTPLQMHLERFFKLTDPVRVAWHRVNHLRRRGGLASGPWMAYAEALAAARKA